MTKILKTAWNLAKILPGISGLNFILSRGLEPKDPINGRFWDTYCKPMGKFFGHLAYAIAAGIIFEDWYITGEINPITTNQIMEQRYKERVTEYNKLRDRLFGANGLSDTNKDGMIDFSERAEAYKRMGLESQVQFPQPKLEDLERAVGSYSN